MVDMSAGCESSPAALTIEQFKELARNATDDMLHSFVSECTNILHSRQTMKHNIPEQKLDELFKYVPDFLSKPSVSLDVSTNIPQLMEDFNVDNFSHELRTELESLGLEVGNKREVKTKWMVSNPLKHSNLNSFKGLKGAVEINDFKCIKTLMGLVNKHEDIVGEVNSCIVNCFRIKSGRHYAHSDNEDYLDKNCSIGTISIGPTRKFSIYEHKHKPEKILRSFNVEHGSLMIMKPGSQELTKHKIERQEGLSSNVRYSISFRRILSPEITPSISKSENTCSENSNVYSELKPTTLIVGTSIADDLDTKRLIGKSKHVDVVKICKRGGHIKTISAAVDGFYNSGKCKISQVNKIIVSLGTNDIRHCKSGVGHLYFPIINLIQMPRYLYNLYYLSDMLEGLQKTPILYKMSLSSTNCC